MKFKLVFKILVLSFWVIISFNLFFRDKNMKTCINTSYIFQQEVSGIVDRKEENNWNHSTEIAYFTNGDKFVWSDDVWIDSGFYKDIEHGDSLNKRKGSFVIETHKKDTIIFFDMLKNCSDYDENKVYD